MIESPPSLIVRWFDTKIHDLLTKKVGFQHLYRTIIDDLIIKSILTAQQKSDEGEVWANFKVAPEGVPCGLNLAKLYASTSPFRESLRSCHRKVHDSSAIGDEGAYQRLRQLIWGGDVEADFSKMESLCQAYNLTLNQIDAVGWYSSPQAGWRGGDVPRTEDDEPGQRDVVKALTQAIRCIPSLRDLGIQMVTFRVIGGHVPKVGHLKKDTIILHGVRKMKNDGHHFMSTSITPNVKGFVENLKKTGEVLAICGSSGRYIQWLGRHSGSMDGEEVLYPPGTVTRFLGQVGELTVRTVRAPLFLLMECDPPANDDNVVDDFKFQSSKIDNLTEVRTEYATLGRDLTW